MCAAAQGRRSLIHYNGAELHSEERLGTNWGARDRHIFIVDLWARTGLTRTCAHRTRAAQHEFLLPLGQTSGLHLLRYYSDARWGRAPATNFRKRSSRTRPQCGFSRVRALPETEPWSVAAEFAQPRREHRSRPDELLCAISRCNVSIRGAPAWRPSSPPKVRTRFVQQWRGGAHMGHFSPIGI